MSLLKSLLISWDIQTVILAEILSGTLAYTLPKSWDSAPCHYILGLRFCVLKSNDGSSTNRRPVTTENPVLKASAIKRLLASQGLGPSGVSLMNLVLQGEIEEAKQVIANGADVNQGTWCSENVIVIYWSCIQDTQTSVSLLAYLLWHYRLWSFHGRDTKLERFLPKNQHTQLD